MFVQRDSLIVVMLVILLNSAAAIAEGPSKPGTAASASSNPFGIKPEGITSPEMLATLHRLREAGMVEGRRGSLSFFRWSNAEPPKLTHLGLWGSQIDNGLLALSATLPDLEHVALYETNVDDAGLQALAKLPKVRYLSITAINRYEKPGFGAPQWSYPFLSRDGKRQRVTGNSLSPLAASLPALEGLDLLDVRLNSADLEALVKFPKLSALSLPNAIDEESVQHLQACRRLNALTLGHREITAIELGTLAKLKSLRRLTLINARLADDALTALSQLATVTELHLEDCGLKDERLQHLRGTAKLSHLSLQRNEINGPGLAYLVPLKLTVFGLEFNNLADDTLKHLPQLASVEKLGLSYCRGVTDVGIHSGTLQSMSQLKQLQLRGLNQLTDAALDDLAKFKQLEHLTVRETKVSWDGVKRLQRDLPQLVVFK